MAKISRRKFISEVAAAGTGACVCGLSGCATFTMIGSTPPIPSGSYSLDNNQIRVTLDKVAELGKVGGAVKITNTKLPQPIIVARVAGSEYVALSIKCPHRGVEVEYEHDAKKFRCASLGHSTFALDGALLKGLASRSLKRFEAKLEPNSLVILL